MAQINIEPRPKRGLLPYILAVIVIAAVAAAVYVYLNRGGMRGVEDRTAPPAAVGDTIGAPERR